jgi:hypothetical protein
MIMVGASLTLAGIAFSVSDDEGLGSWFTLAGLLLSILALHRFGRLGPDSGRIGTSAE